MSPESLGEASLGEASLGEASLGEADYPALFQIADSSSISGQRWFKRLTGIELAFVMLGGIAGVVTVAGGPAADAAAWLAAISFLGAGAAKLLGRQRGYERDWFNGRAVAETVKSLTWRYMTRTPPFEDDASADAEMIRHIRETMQMRALAYHQVGGASALSTQITERMRMTRKLPWQDLLRFYQERRLRDQAEWYRGRAQRHERQRDGWFLVSLLAQAAAVLLAVASVFSDEIAGLNVLGLAATVAAVATAWSQVNRHDEQARGYALAYQELLLALSLQPEAMTADDLPGLVISGEAAISREHTLWVAKRTEPLPTDAAAQP